MKRLIPIILLLALSCNQKTPQQQIQTALENLLVLSPGDNIKMQKIPIPITWKFGNLNGTTLAATHIYYDRAEIVFDWDEIRKRRETLEPIIAHELDHINDAFNVYGVDQFISLVDRDKNQPWNNRELEKSAIKQENETRKFLLKNYPEKFKGMSMERKV